MPIGNLWSEMEHTVVARMACQPHSEYSVNGWMCWNNAVWALKRTLVQWQWVYEKHDRQLISTCCCSTLGLNGKFERRCVAGEKDMCRSGEMGPELSWRPRCRWYYHRGTNWSHGSRIRSDLISSFYTLGNSAISRKGCLLGKKYTQAIKQVFMGILICRPGYVSALV